MACGTIRPKINLSWDFFFLPIFSPCLLTVTLFSIEHRIISIWTYLGLFQYRTDKFSCYNGSCLVLSSLKMQKPHLHLSCMGQHIRLVVWTLIPIWHSSLTALWGGSEQFLGLWQNSFIKIYCWDGCFNSLVMPGNLFLCKWFLQAL